MNVLICCDNEDPSIGHFVERCALATRELVEDIGVIIEDLASDQLSSNRVNELANVNGDAPFICAAYSHGGENSLYNSSLNEDYISDRVNFNSFENTLIYTWACLAAQDLGQALIDNGCQSFIGYVEKVGVPNPGDDTLDLFVECALHGLRLFYENGLTIGEAVDEMINFYDEKEMELIDMGLLEVALYLQDHSNALDIIGRRDLQLSEVIPQQ